MTAEDANLEVPKWYRGKLGKVENGQLRVTDRLRERAGGLDGAALHRACERSLVGVVAAHILDSRTPGGESDRGADQAGADDCE